MPETQVKLHPEQMQRIENALLNRVITLEGLLDTLDEHGEGKIDDYLRQSAKVRG